MVTWSSTVVRVRLALLAVAMMAPPRDVRTALRRFPGRLLVAGAHQSPDRSHGGLTAGSGPAHGSARADSGTIIWSADRTSRQLRPVTGPAISPSAQV